MLILQRMASICARQGLGVDALVVGVDVSRETFARARFGSADVPGLRPDTLSQCISNNTCL